MKKVLDNDAKAGDIQGKLRDAIKHPADPPYKYIELSSDISIGVANALDITPKVSISAVFTLARG